MKLLDIHVLTCECLKALTCPSYNPTRLPVLEVCLQMCVQSAMTYSHLNTGCEQ